MGMFDSFYVEDVEVQTKKLDNALRSYHIGDNAPNYEDGTNPPCGSYYLIEDAYPSRRWYGLIIINNVFLDAIVSDDKEQTERETKVAFEVYRSHPLLRSLKLEDVIKQINTNRDQLNRRLGRIHAACSEYAEFINPSPRKFRISIDHYTKRFEAGESLVDVIQDLCKNKKPVNDHKTHDDFYDDFYDDSNDEDGGN
jgi:hypothetical protein